MAFLTQRIIQCALRSPASIRRTQLWDAPELVTLRVREGVVPGNKPPVRIFLGTEPAQFKAERIFIWSIEQVRDPARVYEIYLMKNLTGFRSRFWLTGFTNYRFAIPHFAAGSGRAIYNDVDQVYLQDPALLFDLPMAEHGYLSVTAGDISVALLDCKKMARLWTLQDARTKGKNELLARAANTPGLWGKLDGGWNARDGEYTAGQCGVLHYTTLHRQPWHPFPNQFAYQKNPHGDIWYELEKGANEAAFQAFSADRPSQGLRRLRSRITGLSGESGKRRNAPSSGVSRKCAGMAELLQDSHAQSLLYCRIKALSADTSVHIPGDVRSIQHMDPLADSPGKIARAKFDAVLCTNLLEFVPDDDVPWLLEQLFTRASQLLYCRVGDLPAASQSAHIDHPRPWRRNTEWWHYQFHLVGRRHPEVRWQLHLETGAVRRFGKPVVIEGNESSQREFRVWVINSHKLGHSSQSNALAEMLGWRYEKKQVNQGPRELLPVLLHLGAGQLGPCRAPWPDVVIGCGWWTNHVARWIKAQSGGRSRLLLAGRKSRGIKSTSDIVVCCEHFHLPVHQRRVETLLPAHPLTNQGLDAARQRGEKLLEGAAKPRVALLVGGDSRQYVLSPEAAALMGRRVLEQVKQLGGSLWAVTSRRTSKAAASALAEALKGEGHVHVWSPGGKDNPYREYLASADILVVSGESESMLADTIATTKPVFIYSLEQRRAEVPMAIGQWLLQRTSQQPKNRRGTERPQQGFEYLCARLLQLEWILPPRDMEEFHQCIAKQGFVSGFGQSLQVSQDRRTYRQEELGDRLRIMLDQPPQAENLGVVDIEKRQNIYAIPRR